MVSMHKIILISSIFLLTLLSLPQQSLASSISDFSPVSHWTCDELSGVRYDSQTTNSNDLTDNNTVLYDTGLLDNACLFNSTNSEYLSITSGDQTNLNLTNSFSFSTWVNFTSTFPADTRNIIYSRVDSSNGFVFELLYTGGIYSFRSLMYESGSPNVFNVPFTFSTDTWYHVVLTFNGTSHLATLYIDGTSVSTQTFSHNNGSVNQRAFLGAGSENINSFFNGLLDETTLFDSELTSTDVTTLYNSGTPLPYSGGTTEPPATTTPTTTPTTSDNGDLVFMLSVIVFFLSTFWVGYIISMFRKSS